MSATLPLPGWPLLLTMDQLCDYLGGMDERTLKKICPVPPIDLGADLLRYRRPDIDDWVAQLPPRLLKYLLRGQDAARTPDAVDDEQPEVEADRRLTAVERARARAAGGPAKWRKTG